MPKMEPTQWTKIRSGDADYLVSRYWDPVHRFLRSRLPKGAPAEDLTQDLFLRFIQKNIADRADPEKGSFRNFLFHIARQFLYDTLRKRKNILDAAATLESFDADEEATDPKKVFEAEWYRELVHRARRRVKAFYLEKEQPERYLAFRLFYFGSEEAGHWNQNRISEELKVPVHQVNNYVARARQRYAEEIRALVSEYCAEEKAVELELEHLTSFLSEQSPSGKVDLSSLAN